MSNLEQGGEKATAISGSWLVLEWFIPDGAGWQVWLGSANGQTRLQPGATRWWRFVRNVKHAEVTVCFWRLHDVPGEA